MTGKLSSGQSKFQSTLPRRERRPAWAAPFADRDFNPRSHEGSDADRIGDGGRIRYFNPRSHEGSDGAGYHFLVRKDGFQSTLPRRERRHIPVRSSHHEHFNPRSHEGSDWIPAGERLPEDDFNPRSHEGSDSESRFHCSLTSIFNPPSPRRERRMRQSWTPAPICYFNPRSHEGSDK